MRTSFILGDKTLNVVKSVIDVVFIIENENVVGLHVLDHPRLERASQVVLLLGRVLLTGRLSQLANRRRHLILRAGTEDQVVVRYTKLAIHYQFLLLPLLFIGK